LVAILPKGSAYVKEKIMPIQGKPLAPSKNFSHKCYKTKDDKRHATAFFTGGVETAEERVARLERLHKWKKELEAKKEREIEVNAPGISKWDPEWSYAATGMRMSKSELKSYCKQHGKIWENG
jgi:hypothetical protein